MSDAFDTAPANRAVTAGSLLRQARQAKGLHIAALAASIKVTPRKLELLESDQIDQLPDATFARALAQTVCRTLKVDAAPVLALLPLPRGHRLEMVADGLNTPFRERPGRLVPKEWASVASPTLWLAALLLVAALVVYAVPSGWLRWPGGDATRTAESPPPVPADSVLAPVPGATTEAAVPTAPSAAAPVYVPVLPTPASTALPMSTPAAAAAPVIAADAAASGAAVSAPVSVLQVRTTAASWVGVTDSRGKSLVGRVLQAGEYIGVDAAPPLKLKIGNAAATQIVFRGEPFEMARFTRDNVARFELK